MTTKQEQNREKEGKELTILVKTMVNGYMLDVNGEGYMYFNAQSLVEGFCVHVGMKRLNSMTQEEIKDFLEATKDGSLNRKLQDEVTVLEAKIEELKEVIKTQKKEIREAKKYYV